MSGCGKNFIMGIGFHITPAKGGYMENRENEQSHETGQPLEDRALKAAAQFMGEELLPLLGIVGKVKRIAPTEQVHLEVKDFQEDFNYEMEDGSWRHLEFESDSITKEDLRRFRSYEAVTSYYYKTEVVTCVICSSRVRKIQSELKEGINTYRVQVIRLKDENADHVISGFERKQGTGHLNRHELVRLLLTPLMDGNMAQSERIQKSLRILMKERDTLKHEDFMRMQAVLYTLAIKFLTRAEMNTIKEVLGMTVLGEMLFQDGVEHGIEMGIREMILDNLEEGITKERISEKLCKRFHLDKEKSWEYIKRYSMGNES